VKVSNLIAQFACNLKRRNWGRFRTVCYLAPDLVKRTFGLRPIADIT
jgi:hypothetical protein